MPICANCRPRASHSSSSWIHLIRGDDGSFWGFSMILRCWFLLLVSALVYGSHLRTKNMEGTISDGSVAVEWSSQYGTITEPRSSSAQRCGTRDVSRVEMHDIEQRLSRTVPPSGGSLLAKVNVDVYFHVVENSVGDGTVTDTDIGDQMTVLNAAFLPAGFRFVLKGVTRIENAEWHGLKMGSPQEMDMKRSLRMRGTAVLNIYLTTNADEVVGWATYPSNVAAAQEYDGVVLDHRTLPNGSLAPFNAGGTLVHQAGHWLGLQHTFHGGCDRDPVYGDGVSDTPASSLPTTGCPTPTTVVDSCTGSEGQLKGHDLVHNYMDLADDACQSQFTKGQQLRMHLSWQAYRQGG